MENKRRFGSLTTSADFQRLKVEGQCIHVNSWLLVNVQPTQLGMLRCGWTIPRQIGSAVVRNRFKRWGREYLRRWCKVAANNSSSLDINLIFKRKEKGFYNSVKHKEFDGAIEKLLVKVQRYSK